MVSRRLISLEEAGARIGLAGALRQRIIREFRRRERREGRKYLVKEGGRNSPCFVDADALDVSAARRDLEFQVTQLQAIVWWLVEQCGFDRDDLPHVVQK